MSKNTINIKHEIIVLESYDFNAKVFNSYQIRIRIREIDEIFFDWYHTTGTLVMNLVGHNTSIGKFMSAEEVSSEIIKRLDLHIK